MTIFSLGADVFHGSHISPLCYALLIDLEFLKFTCMLMIWKLTTVGRGICAHSVNSDQRKSHANLLRLNPAKSIVLPICKVPWWHFFLVTLSSRQRTVVLTMIWVEVIILVLSVVRSMRTSMIYDRLRISCIYWSMSPILLFVCILLLFSWFLISLTTMQYTWHLTLIHWVAFNACVSGMCNKKRLIDDIFDVSDSI
jgi:hypothetical protein